MSYFIGIFKKFWKENNLADIISLDGYKQQRDYKYPKVSVKFFKDWLTHKEWMQNELKKEARRIHNKGVLERFFKSRNSPYIS